MKKFVFLISSVILCFAISCNNDKKGGGMSDKAKKNLDGNAAINKAVESGDLSKLGDYIADDAVDHSDQGDVKGLAAIKEELAKYSQQAENMKAETIKEFADDDNVIAWYNYSGTMKIDQMGMKKGDSYKMMGVEVSKWKDGKATEHWTFMLPADMAKMMGGGQNSNPMMGDTTKPK